MVTETLSSSAITNRDATPQKPSDLRIGGGRPFHRHAVISPTTAKTVGSIYKMLQIPADAIVYSVALSSGSYTTTGAFDVGLYQTTENGGAVVSASFFAAAVDCHTAALTKSQLINKNAVTVAKMEQRIWEILASTTDTDKQRAYDVCLTSTETLNGTQSVCLELSYKLV